MIFSIYLLIIVLAIAARLNVLRGRHMHKHGKGTNTYYTDYNPQNSMPFLHYGLEQTGGIPFTITTEKWYHRTLKSLGLATELRTGFRDFDERFFIMTDTPAHLREILTNHEFRKKISLLFHRPVRALYSGPTRLWFRVNRIGIYNALRTRTSTPEALNLETLDILRDIRAALAKHPAPYAPKIGRSARIKAFAFILAHACFFGIALVGILPIMMDSAITLEFQKLKSDALFVGALITCGWFGLITAIIGGRTWFGWVVADFAVFGIVGIILTTGFVMREANIRFDFSEPAQQTLNVYAKSCLLKCYVRRRRSTTSDYYELGMDECMNENQTIKEYLAHDYKCGRNTKFIRNLYLPWDGEREYLTKEVSAQDYLRHKVGTPYIVPVHYGLLGYEWVDPDEFEPRYENLRLKP